MHKRFYFFFLTLLLTGAYAVAPQAQAAHAGVDEALSGKLSYNWAGYAATGAKYTAVGASWKMPVPTDATSSSLSTDAVWVGIGGIKKSDLIQAGTQTIVKNGRTSYRAWYELLPDYQQQIALEIHSGDEVRVDIFELIPDLWHISFINLTTGAGYEKTLEYKSKHASAEWIVEMPLITSGGVQLYAPLDHFGTLSFKDAHATVKGTRKTVSETRADGMTMIAKLDDSIALATPSKLGGDTFSVVRSSAKAKPATTVTSKKASSSGANIIWTK